MAQSARLAIAEAKQRLHRPVIGWVTKIYYLELLRALEGTLNLYLESFYLLNTYISASKLVG
jgi:hypothetical protein